ncbi:hypothetical protein GOP47_0019731 [Adiantum capillus-veneris]|uniref:non-specific serine/threonine protein kinase n=1 Tax=Adiantum capillus-veneris TaxID=13818 RepID=A0A9D4Z9W9_ADICA|nr:hypothetical protein GOP47_0019731 [Adiantum capillus-veneris]
MQIYRRLGYMMFSPSPKLIICLLIFSLGLPSSTIQPYCTAISDAGEVQVLQAIKRNVGDVFNRLSNWNGDDPCGNNWVGVICTSVNGTQHVVELRLLNMNFTGTLAPDLGNLTHLEVMDFMWNNITGSIPGEIGNLSSLRLLLLNGNKLNGVLPPELGSLSNLTHMQIDENNISGPIPQSFQFLNKGRHFHMNNNSLNGSIPPELGRLESMLHILFDNNDLSGELPPELSNISTLIILQLDNNHFSGSIPSSYGNMSKLSKMSLRNCNLTGNIPELSASIGLIYLDLSHNQLTGELPANVSQTVTTIDLSFNQLNGELPPVFYELRSLELLLLQNNSLDGNVAAANLKHNAFTNEDSILIMDFQNNNFSELTTGAFLDITNVTLRLSGNPVCNGPSAPSKFCGNTNTSINTIPTTPLMIPPACSASSCDSSSNQELNYGLLALNVCKCAYPLTVRYRLKSPSFAIYQPYESILLTHLSNGSNLSNYQTNLSDFAWEPGPRLSLIVKLFPSQNTSEFNKSEVTRLYNQYSTWSFPINRILGPYEMISFEIKFPYNVSEAQAGSKSRLSTGAIAGIVIGAAAFTALVVAAFMLVIARYSKYRHVLSGKQAAKHHKPVKVDGVKQFTFKELRKVTNNFDDSMKLGQGGYGRVYRGVLADGSEVAIKRAQEELLQGEKEFSTELQLLSRVHHRNLVSLVGYCDDESEQLLVYEYMANGTLRDHLQPNSKAPLDFAARLQIALEAAKGILYLHTEANPPIFHRDIKATNILLDERMRAKVADFGLSKLASLPELEGAPGGYVSTLVKGTPGYLDPEYLLTHKLTNKSDVYSFGVVLLELITGQQAISKGKNLVKEVNLASEAGNMLSILDPRIENYPTECLQPFLHLALACCRDETDSRPSMADVVQELEFMLKLMP